MKKFTFLLCMIITAAQQLSAQCSQCTPVNCSLTKPYGGLCSSAPDDTAGVPYESVVSFYIPTKLVDPTALSHCGGCSYIEVHHITIAGIQGLPTGVMATPNHSNGYYDVWGGDTIGCVHFCGTPVAPGMYKVGVNLTADIVAVGTPLGNVPANGQALTFYDTVQIFPGTSACPQSFSMGSGNCVTKSCDSITVDLNATLTNPHCPDLISYTWKYGNGQGSSIKQPGVINYNTPDTFPLTLTTTFYSYRIKSIYLNLTGGYYGDIEEYFSWLSPDPYFIIPSLAFNNRANHGSNVNTITFSNLDIVIPENNCADSIEIQAWDADTGPPQGTNPIGSPDDKCSTFYITPSTLHQVSKTDTNATVSVQFDTAATSSITETINIIIFPPTPLPVIVASADTICSNDSALLRLTPSLPGFAFTWFKDDSIELAGKDSSIHVNTKGSYKVKITNLASGCEEWSSSHDITVMQSPPSPISIIFNGTQEFINPYPSSGCAVNWYYNGNFVAGETGKFLPYLGDGTYTAELYSTKYSGCKTSAPAKSIVSGITEAETNLIANLTVFPNPNSGKFNIRFSSENGHDITVGIHNMLGQAVYEKKLEKFNGEFNEDVDLSALSKGVYFVAVESGQGAQNRKIVVQ